MMDWIGNALGHRLPPNVKSKEGLEAKAHGFAKDCSASRNGQVAQNP